MMVQVKRQRAKSASADLQACYLHMRLQNQNQEADDGAGASGASGRCAGQKRRETLAFKRLCAFFRVFEGVVTSESCDAFQV
jgi:hypothetical protein